MGERVVRDLSRNLYVNGPSVINRPLASMRKKNLKMHCCRCFHKRRASLLTCVTICLLVLTYNALGGVIFLAIESPKSYIRITQSKANAGQTQGEAVRLKTVERLWIITENLNILYKKNWTKLAEEELVYFERVILESIQKEQKEKRWTFAESFLYALTIITTIGSGNIGPTSALKKIATTGYAALGIPMIIFYLSIVGVKLSREFRALYYKISPESVRCKNFHLKSDCISHSRCHIIQDTRNAMDSNKTNETQVNTPFKAALNSNGLNAEYHWMCQEHTQVPIILSVLLIVLYGIIGAFVFNATENWNFLDALYFSFSILATIGFGYLIPGSYASTISTKAEDFAIGICCLYIHIGVVVIAVCFNLIHDDMGQSLRGFTSFCMGSSKSRVIYTMQAMGENSLMPVI